MSKRTHARIAVASLLVSASSLMGQPVVQSYSRSAQAATHWTVAARPALEIGGQDGVGLTEFSGIVGVTRQSDGTLVVADGSTRELRMFDANGRHLRTTTRHGLGPGETEYLSGFSAVADTLAIFDGRRAVHVFAPDGKWLRSLILPLVPGYVNPAIGALNATDIVVNLTRTGEIWVRVYVPEDGVSSRLGRANAMPSYWSIYDRQGHWIADCRLPPRFAPSEIGADYVVGVSRDEDDVERVTVFTLRR